VKSILFVYIGETRTQRFWSAGRKNERSKNPRTENENETEKLKQKTKTKKDSIVFRKLQEEEKGYLLIVYHMCEQEMP